MEIRVAKKEDFIFVLDGAKQFSRLVNRPDILPHPDSDNFRKAVGDIFMNDFTTVILAMDDGQLLGGIGLMVTPYLWDKSKIACEELFWWVKPGAPNTTALRLIKSAKKFAKSSDAEIMSFNSLVSSPEGVGRVYERMGTSLVQHVYAGVI